MLDARMRILPLLTKKVAATRLATMDRATSQHSNSTVPIRCNDVEYCDGTRCCWYFHRSEINVLFSLGETEPGDSSSPMHPFPHTHPIHNRFLPHNRRCQLFHQNCFLTMLQRLQHPHEATKTMHVTSKKTTFSKLHLPLAVYSPKYFPLSLQPNSSLVNLPLSDPMADTGTSPALVPPIKLVWLAL